MPHNLIFLFLSLLSLTCSRKMDDNCYYSCLYDMDNTFKDKCITECNDEYWDKCIRPFSPICGCDQNDRNKTQCYNGCYNRAHNNCAIKNRLNIRCTNTINYKCNAPCAFFQCKPCEDKDKMVSECINDDTTCKTFSQRFCDSVYRCFTSNQIWECQDESDWNRKCAEGSPRINSCSTNYFNKCKDACRKR